MSQFPEYCKKHGCVEPDIILLAEGDDFWSMQCRKCFRVQVFTKPKTKAKARYEREAGRLKPRHSWEAEKLYSFSKNTGRRGSK